MHHQKPFAFNKGQGGKVHAEIRLGGGGYVDVFVGAE